MAELRLFPRVYRRGRTMDVALQWLAGQMDQFLGLSLKAEQITFWQSAARAVVIYIALIAIVRFGKKRFLGRATAFDIILTIIIGSIASRGITGNAPLGDTLAACVMLIAVHWLFSLISRSSPLFSDLIKGSSTPIIKDGRVSRKAMWDEHMSDDDLREDLRSEGVGDPEVVAEARLERDGKLSVVKK